MIPPPLLLGATLLFWGWQTDLLVFAAVMAVVLESPRWVKVRWEFSQTDLDRVWNLCTLLFLGAALYALTSTEGAKAWAGLAKQNTSGARAEALNKSARSALLLFQWAPLALFPMAAAQAFGQREKIDLSTFSWWLRRRRKDPTARPPGATNVGYPYFTVCLVAASAARARSPWFFAGLCALLGWALWRGRPRTFTPLAWVGSLLVAMAFGFVLQLGLVQGQALLQRLDSELMNRWWGGRESDPKEARTRLGSLAPLKLSGRIVFRVKAGRDEPPGLLREASYHFFKTPIWASTNRDFVTVDEETNGMTWILLTNTPRRTVTIAGFLDGGKGVLPLPQGVARLEKLPVFGLEKNPPGAVRSIGGPGFVEFLAPYEAGAAIDSPPNDGDFEIPAGETNALDRVIADLNLTNPPPAAVLRGLGAFFAGQFEYSTEFRWTSSNETNLTALGRFLLRSHKGHCEYFATATTLLLRRLGVPARYAVGYAVQERKGDEYVVRERHAHAWCLVWVDGAWREVDHTPGVWAQIEKEHASFWEPLSDLWSRAWFTFSKFRWGQSDLRRYAVWLIVPPLVVVAARLAFSKQLRRAKQKAREIASRRTQPGDTSEFYRVERRLAELGLERRSGETLCAWLVRLRATNSVEVAPLEPALKLHYRLRFDPAGLSTEEGTMLREGVEAWLQTAGAHG